LERTAAQTAAQSAQSALAAAEKLVERSTVLEADIKKKRRRIGEIDCDPRALPTGFDEQSFVAAQKQLEDLKPSHNRYLAIQSAEQRLLLAKTEHLAAKTAHDTARGRYRELDAERKLLPFASADQAREAIEEFKILDRQLYVVQESVRQEGKLKAERETRVVNARRRLEEHKANERRLIEHRKKEGLYDETARQMRKLRADLNAAIGPELEARSSENLALLTNGRYSELKLDGNFRPTVIDDGARKEVISGGEEDVVALALRLALSELIQERQGRPLSLLILDEVFGSLDAERRSSVLERLAGIRGRFEQILVISHIEEINQVADQCLFVYRDRESKSAHVTDNPPDMSMDLI
jgi:exonuclease SbcC